MKAISESILRASRFLAGAGLLLCTSAFAAVVQLNSSGGTSTTDGLRIYVEDTSKIQVIRRNATASAGQLYSPSATPPSNSLDNGIFLRANGRVYGPSHTVSSFSPTAFSTGSVSGPTPANPITDGTSQTATGKYGIASGPQLTVDYSYLRPYDFVTMSVTLVIPSGYAVSAANPVRYYHAVDTYLGGSDNGCGVAYTDTNGRRVVGTYPPASGTTCPSSTSVPAAVTIVESFRERSGPPFSHYCTANWGDFWDTSNPYAACSVMNPVSLPDTVTTSYQDTGIAIEYDFTAPGTYTFAYDFVIGSPKVPPYDHLELQYTPGGNLCPLPVKVLGCTSSTVPCPAGSELNANLSGILSATGGGGATWTPSANFSIASGTPITTVTAQPNAPGGTITLGAGSLSAVPLNGVKCWNGSSATCTMTLPNIGCFASDLDACSNLTGSPARCGATGNRLYTKVANQAMSFDLVALKGTPKAVDTSFNSGSGNPVSVDLVTSAATAIGSDRCPTSSPVAVSGVTAQTITFTSGRPATATSYTVPAGQNTRAYRNVWVRFNQGAGGTFCSNDRFAIRPASFSAISSGTATADSTGASATATPLVNAGASFTLTADTGTPGYNGTPAITPALIEWLAMPVRIGTLAGSFSTAATAATGNGASGAAFTYDEVGYFRFQPQGVFDDGFTSAYQDASDTVCINTSPNDFSNTANSAGKVGCKFGNTTASNHFGRFVPDHFDVNVTQACTAGAFSYSGQPFSVTVIARGAGGTATQNYDKTGAAVFAKANTLAALDSTGVTANPGPGAFVAGSNAVAAAAFTAGVATTILPAYTFTAPSTVPTVVRVRSSDSDGVTSLRIAPAITVEGTTTVRSGRLLLSNAYGSELLRLAVPAKTQYWTTTGWATNVADSCTVLTVPSNANAGLTNALKTKTTASLASPVVAGDVQLRLTAPGAGNAGLVDISGNILRGTNTWLSLPAPTARACFGACGPRSPVIYQRESY